MNVLDTEKIYSQYDLGHSYQSIFNFPFQTETAWKEVSSLDLPTGYSSCKNILFSGMGGSAYGARIVKSLYQYDLKVPIDLVSDYRIPAYVNSDTLVVCASYSGNTEETLSSTREAESRKAKLLGISTGGKLEQFFREKNYPGYFFKDSLNPSGQPRLGQGYMQTGQLGLLSKLGYIKISGNEFPGTISLLKEKNRILTKDSQTDVNPAKKLAVSLQNKIVNIIGGEFLEGAIHAIRNPFHETGKHFANYYIVPELNHHLMEGLSYPFDLKNNSLFFFIDSDLYTPSIAKRMELTRDVVAKNGLEIVNIKLKFPDKLGQVFETIQLGSFITFYMAMLHQQDPAKIPWVDYFKEQLSK